MKFFFELVLFTLIVAGCTLFGSFFPEAERHPASVEVEGLKLNFVYFGDDIKHPNITYEHVKEGLSVLASEIEKTCAFKFNYTVEKRSPIKFSKTIEFPLEEKVVETEHGKASFIYDQYDLFREFNERGLLKMNNEMFIIKTDMMGKISKTGKPRDLCGYANPDVQFDKDFPSEIKQNIRNTLLFNSNQSNCPKSFSFIVAHEVAHLLVQDDPAHKLTDEFNTFFYLPEDNILSDATGKSIAISRKYQCPKIIKTIRELLQEDE